MVETVNLPDTPAASWAPGESVSGMPGADATRTKVTGDLANIQREKVAASDKVYGEIDAAQARLMPRIEQLSKDAGVEAEKMKPWDADAEMAKRRTDPIEAFGSLASVAGILASAFTHAPMENALNASAAAMNSIRAGDEKAYDRASKAWESNQKMYMDRHKIQHDAYQDAVSLLNVNMSAANTKLQVLAARFGDKQVQTLLEAGMNKEVEEVLAARQRNALALEKEMPKIIEENANISRLFALGFDPKNATSEKSQEALQKFQKEQAELERSKRVTSQNPTSVALGNFMATNPNATPDEISAYLRTLKGPSDAKLDLEREKNALSAKRAEELTRHNRALEDIQNGRGDVAKLRAEETARHNKAMEGLTEKRIEAGGGAKDLTTDRQRAQDVKKFRRELEDAENEDGTPKHSAQEIAKKAAEYERSLKVAASAPSANRADQIKSLYDRAGMMSETIDKADALMAKHKAITGVGGTVTRPLEAIGNVFGSNDTDRAQFRRYVSELQEWGTRVLNESSGRPLSAEVSKLNNILPGLAWGDTTANTVRAYRELKPLIATIQAQMKKRMDGTWDASTSPGAGNAQSTKAPSWMDWPEVK